MNCVATTRVATSVRDLTVSYRGHIAVRRLSGTFAAGGLTAVIGPNGAGKSSLLAALAGALRFEGQVARPPLTRIAYLPQAPSLDPSIPARVGEMVAMGLWSRLGSFRPLDAAGRNRVAQALSAVGMDPFARCLMGELSVGQRQRVLFARALVQDAALVLLDEPSSAVDPDTIADLVGVLQHWKREGRTVIAVLHDLDLVRAHADEVLLLHQRAIDWGPAARVLQSREAGRAWRTPEHRASARDVTAEGLA